MLVIMNSDPLCVSKVTYIIVLGIGIVLCSICRMICMYMYKTMHMTVTHTDAFRLIFLSLYVYASRMNEEIKWDADVLI